MRNLLIEERYRYWRQYGIIVTVFFIMSDIAEVAAATMNGNPTKVLVSGATMLYFGRMLWRDLDQDRKVDE